MNKIYRVVWNEATRAWVAVAEIAKSHGKRSSGVRGHTAAPAILTLPRLKALVASLAFMGAVLPAPTFAQVASNQLPTGGNVVAGTATITQNAAVMNINQSTARAAIDWATFNVGSAAQVNFNQPSSSSVTLNRVLDSNPSQIFGRITANGQVFLTNSSGVYFARGASVNVGALTATTHSISDADFMAGNYRFTRNGATGSVINEGSLTASLGGYIALLAPEVRNNGVIVAQMGTVALAAGEAYELQFDGNNTLAGIQVEPAAMAALVENGNAVQAPGGLVILSARAADLLQGSVVRNSGVIEASSLVERGGKIVLTGDHITLAAGSKLDASGATGGGEVLVGGGWQGSGGMYQATTVTMEQGASIDVSATKVGDGGTAVLWSDVHNAASQTRAYGTIWARGGAEGGDGGRIETSGARLVIANSVRIDTRAPVGKTGEWLLDPVDITVASSGGNVTGSAIATALQSTNVTLDTSGSGSCTGVTCSGLGAANGDITINDNINVSGGSADTTLTFKADRNIKLNASKSITRSGGFKLNTIFWADSDSDANGGYIYLDNGSAITTNGGGLWMGGGSGTASWTPYNGGSALTVGNGAALGTGANNGIYFDRAVMNTGVGNVKIVGQSAGGFGIWTNWPAGSITTTSGNVSITGISANSMGMIYRDTVTTGTGTIEVTGTGSAASYGGIYLENGNFLSSSGNITLDGTNSNAGGWGIKLDITLPGNTPPTLGYMAGGNSSSNILLKTDSINIVQGRVASSGTLTIEPKTAGTTIGIAGGAGTLSLPASYFSTNFVNGFSGITVGKSDSGLISIGGNALSYNDPLTLKTGGSIFFSTTSVVTGNNNALTLWTRAGGNDAADDGIDGSIWLPVGALINTGGGNITIGGGADPTVGYALGDDNATSGENNARYRGVSINGTLNAAGGNISILGRGNSGASRGVSVGGAISTTGSGTITIKGVAKGSSDGIALGDTALGGSVGTLSSGNGVIALEGTKGTGSNGINLSTSGSSISTTGTGNLNMISTGNISGTGVVTVGGATSLAAGSSNITLDNAGNNFTDAVSVVSGNDVSLRDTNAMRLGASTVSGNLTLQTGGAITQSGALAVTGITGITAGSGNNITLGTANNFTGAVSVVSGNNVMLGDASGLELGASTITGTLAVATLSGALTQSGALSVSGTTQLTMLGAGNNITLDNTSNNFSGIVSVPAVGGGPAVTNLILVGSNAMSLGAVKASGTIDVATLTNNLTLTGAVATTNATADAIKLNAGKSTAAGTATGGNIIVSGGSVSVGSGGRATLYSGSVSGSTGLTTLVGSGSGRFRYNSDEAASTFTTALTAGANAIYREQPSVSVTVDGKSMTYGDSLPTLTGSVTAGALQNGDTAAYAISNRLDSTSGNIRAASYTLNASPLADLGYALSYVNGTLTVNQKTLTVGYTGVNRTYDGTTDAAVTTSDDRVANDTLTIARTATFADKNAGTGKTVSVSGASLTGTDAGNYTVAATGSTTADITKASLTVTANAASKTYDGLAYSGGNGAAYSGFVNSETSAVLGGTLAYGGSSQGAINAGSYVLTPSGLTSGNYNFTFTNGSLSIAKANATVTANSDTVTYNGLAQSVIGFTASGLVNGETIAVLDGVTTSGGSGTNAGGYVHTASGTDENYDLTLVDGALTIVAVVILPVVDVPPPPPLASPTTLTDPAESPTGTPIVTGGGVTGGAPVGGFSSPIPLLNVNPDNVISLNTGGSAAGGDGGDAAGVGQVGAGGISISLDMAPAGSAGGGVQNRVVTVSVPKAMATAGTGFSFELPAQVRESVGTGAVQATQADGSPLPGWIEFNPATQRFEAGAVPDRGLPLQVMIRAGTTQVLVVISERAE